MTNRGKLNAGIDLKTPAGRDVFLRLVGASDIVVENFSRGVLDRLGLDYATLRSANPDIILASISSQGDDGPDAGLVSFGSTLEAMAGLAAITGYRDGPPVVSGIHLNFPDQVVAIFASSMIATAWHARKNGMGGAHLGLSQRELTSFLCGEAFLAPERQGRFGNGQAGLPVQDCFQAADGGWVAASIRGADLPALATLVGGAGEDELAVWVAARPAAEAVGSLRAAGIAAATVLEGNGVLAERGHGWDGAVVGLADGDLVKGTFFGDDAAPAPASRPAALVGADTREVLRRVAGYGDAEIDALVASGAVCEAGSSETR
jgi:crotonobetainyl-CoA:carnitine CoA-transferase CaiB-like acyl-CoA transferase